MSKILASVICAAALSLSSAAYAVDIENQDGTDHQLTVSIGDNGPVTMTLKAGETKTNICSDQACILQINESTWEAEADQELVVKDGQLMDKNRG